jgi:hypothetical protein
MMHKERSAVSKFKRRNSLLTVIIVTTILLGCLTTAGIQNSPSASANPLTDRYASDGLSLDPSAYMYGFHLYNLTSWNIPLTGGNFNLTFPANWNVTRLGLNFFNGSLVSSIILNSTPVTTSVTNVITGGYSGSIALNSPSTSWRIPQNSTVYQVQFNITKLTVGQTSTSTTPNALANSTYPSIDGNTGIAQRFVLTNQAQNLSIQLSMFKLLGTTRNLAIEVRNSTSDNHIGGLIKSVSMTPTNVPLGRGSVIVNIPYVNLTAGYYFIVLHTEDWLNSGGGYIVDTTISKQASNPQSGWLTSNRGVDWQNEVNIAGTHYYFNGFLLSVRTTPTPIPSQMNLRINGFPVADNLIWNQTVWNSVPPYSFTITSDYQIPVLNLTYKAWVYTYGSNRLFPKGYHIMINDDMSTNTTASDSQHNFTLMYFTLGRGDLSRVGVVNSTASTIRLNLKLFANSTQEIAGILNVTAYAQLEMMPVSQTYSGPYSLKLQFIINSTHPGGPYNNVSLAETALAIGPIPGQIDNVIVNNETVDRGLWTYNLRTTFLNVSREAFTSIPQFTLLYGSSFNCTVTIFNNCTASASTTIKGSQPYTTPIANIIVQNSTPIIDVDGPIQVYITVTNTSGVVINKTQLSLTGGLYKFNWTLTGEGIYGIRISSVDPTGYNATRWIGAATVSDYQLALSELTINPTGNLTSQQNVVISASVSYLSHPEFTFNGTVYFTVYVGNTGATVQMQATWNSTAGKYQTTYQVPSVDSVTLLVIRGEAYDLKHRISANFTSTYVTPQTSTPPPPVEPSSLWIFEVAFVAMILLIPTIAYLIERYRKR